MKKKYLLIFLAAAAMSMSGCAVAKVMGDAGSYIAGGNNETTSAYGRAVDISTVVYVYDNNSFADAEETTRKAPEQAEYEYDITTQDSEEYVNIFSEEVYDWEREDTVTETTTKIHETTPVETEDPVDHKVFPDFNAYFGNSFTIAEDTRIHPTRRILYHIDLQNNYLMKDYVDLIETETEYTLIASDGHGSSYRIENYYFDYSGPGKSDMSTFVKDANKVKVAINVYYSSSSEWMEVCVEYADGVNYVDTGYRSSISL